jgi:hypothetical protein
MSTSAGMSSHDAGHGTAQRYELALVPSPGLPAAYGRQL